ncbi:OLD family endonuclease [Bradyrhizobium ottawaense]|uniref:AAA family ATPase n=1 Tax=Bradyrhizobium ottawaense TaxID=931866 RepID=UPI000BE96E29|nr:AAA family ATPase [Bradyrhizobium ottawaense]PDT66401.1 OLD family endonuclease [Bradyrhizobium ottawaense]
MKLIRFKVSDYRSVKDSGWIDVERVTALIGVNESGKTNLLLPLWKLNPAREGEIVPTSDYPKGYFGAVRDDPEYYRFIVAEFELPANLVAKLAEMTGVAPEKLDVVQVGRNFANTTDVRFPKHDPVREIDTSEVSSLVAAARQDLSVATPRQKETGLHSTLLSAIQEAEQAIESKEKQSAKDIGSLVSSLAASVPESGAPTSTIVPRMKRLIEDLQHIQTDLQKPSPHLVEGVHDLVWKNVPRFVYYSNYGNLDSEIYLPHVVENLKRTDVGVKEAAKARTLRVLFKFVRLQPEEILELGRDFKEVNRKPSEDEIAEIATKKRERTILLNSAGTELTREFRAWWKQGDYTFDFQADGDHFRIWVSDSKRPERIELEDRSSGLQWFLSFYLIFLVESAADHRNAILLLDEPGLSLHPLAQRDLSAFFDNLAGTNQLIYTTHSPFLVEADMLDRVRKVFVADDGSTKASSDLRRGSEDPRSLGATYAIYSSLNMNVAESILYGCQPVIVEGPSDQHYLTMMKTILVANGSIAPKREIVFPPCHGAGNAKAIASILASTDEKLPLVLLDSDAAGKKMAQDLKNGLYQAEKGRILQTEKYVSFAESEIEDLIPFPFMVEVVDRWERKADVPFADVAKPGAPIVPQIQAWAKSQSVGLNDGWKVSLSREVKKRALAGPTRFDGSVVESWKKVFEDLTS